ncbi:hypothetical protein ASPSYDRAFT_436601 [Aspergillus sydowii CBS 593.65]|uniref:Uncharacterized protein n=1 Tax=Aspergillus sydowii CBS 593.65 TaxID=1036612 RepID=A0A1L9T6G0_9EURO|nr:uncharacterized protein ASPSYDRAFT_436601 [Aspergillus sydowii CBS 593.65]OJJ54951.1 hypothetical protein ASPSYDRAFT_436601 [Aspergillus sydowii CBS 593.65]
MSGAGCQGPWKVGRFCLIGIVGLTVTLRHLRRRTGLVQQQPACPVFVRGICITDRVATQDNSISISIKGVPLNPTRSTINIPTVLRSQ